jgi:hypothetical protein
MAKLLKINSISTTAFHTETELQKKYIATCLCLECKCIYNFINM